MVYGSNAIENCKASSETTRALTEWYLDGRHGTCDHLLKMICRDLDFEQDFNYTIADTWATFLDIYGHIEAAWQMFTAVIVDCEPLSYAMIKKVFDMLTTVIDPFHPVFNGTLKTDENGEVVCDSDGWDLEAGRILNLETFSSMEMMDHYAIKMNKFCLELNIELKDARKLNTVDPIATAAKWACKFTDIDPTSPAIARLSRLVTLCSCTAEA